jgi:hypothetical protein
MVDDLAFAKASTNKFNFAVDHSPHGDPPRANLLDCEGQLLEEPAM